MTKAMKIDCRNIAIRLANEAVELAQILQLRALLIVELGKLFHDASVLVLEEQHTTPISRFDLHFKNLADEECTAEDVNAAENATLDGLVCACVAQLSEAVAVENTDHKIADLSAIQGLLHESGDAGATLASLGDLLTASDSNNTSCNIDGLPPPASAIMIIHAFIRRFLAGIRKDIHQVQISCINVHIEDTFCNICDHGDHLEHSVGIISDDASEMYGKYSVHNTDDAIDDNSFDDNNASLQTTVIIEDATQDAENHEIFHVGNSISESDSKNQFHSALDCSSVPLIPEVIPSTENDYVDISSGEFQEFEDSISFPTKILEDISSLISDMVNCICDCWIDIPPSPTPANFSSGKELDSLENTFTFQYNLPMVAPAIATHYALKPCSWGFYMCLTFYTCEDLVRISAVRSGQELSLLSLSWVDFSSMCLSCESGVRVFLRFHGVFTSLLICKSRYDEIMKLRHLHSARKLASIVRNRRIREYNLLHAKQIIERHGIGEKNELPKNIPEQISPPKLRGISPRKLPLKGSNNSANLNLLRARGLFSSTKMPFLDLVNLLHAAISMHSAATVSSVEAASKTFEQFHAEYAAQAPSIVLQNHFLPHPPKLENAPVFTENKMRSRALVTSLPSRPRISCHIPKVFNLPIVEAASTPSLSSIELVDQHDDQRLRRPISTPSETSGRADPCIPAAGISNAEFSQATESSSITPRLLDSRGGSVIVRVPTAEKSDAASDFFAPRPPTVFHNKLPSPRVVAQKELLSVDEIPMNAQTPRQYMPHKLVAGGRFKSNPVAGKFHIPNPPHQASHVTLSLQLSPRFVMGLSN